MKAEHIAALALGGLALFVAGHYTPLPSFRLVRLAHMDKPMPSKAGIREMTRTALEDFDGALQTRSFGTFYSKISSLWKKQTSPEALLGVFKVFVDKGVLIGDLKTIDPIFDEVSTINDDGVLVLAGYFPTKPARARFRLKYVYESSDWKLAGITVEK